VAVTASVAAPRADALASRRGSHEERQCGGMQVCACDGNGRARGG